MGAGIRAPGDGRGLGARPLQHIEVATPSRRDAGVFVPRGGRSLVTRPLKQLEVATLRRRGAGEFVPRGGRALGTRPLQQLEVATRGRVEPCRPAPGGGRALGAQQSQQIEMAALGRVVASGAPVEGGNVQEAPLEDFEVVAPDGLPARLVYPLFPVLDQPREQLHPAMGGGHHQAWAWVSVLGARGRQAGRRGLDLDQHRREGSQLARRRHQHRRAGALVRGEHPRGGPRLVDRGQHQGKGVIGQIVEVIPLWASADRLHGRRVLGRLQASRSATRHGEEGDTRSSGEAWVTAMDARLDAVGIGLTHVHRESCDNGPERVRGAQLTGGRSASQGQEVLGSECRAIHLGNLGDARAPFFRFFKTSPKTSHIRIHDSHSQTVYNTTGTRAHLHRELIRTCSRPNAFTFTTQRTNPVHPYKVAGVCAPRARKTALFFSSTLSHRKHPHTLQHQHKNSSFW